MSRHRFQDGFLVPVSGQEQMGLKIYELGLVFKAKHQYHCPIGCILVAFLLKTATSFIVDEMQ